MADISKITLPSGTTYNLKDEVARKITSGAIYLCGSTTTAITDQAATPTSVVIPAARNIRGTDYAAGASYTPVSGDAFFKDGKEFVWDGAHWNEFGDLSGLGQLAYEDEGSVTFTPSGTISGSDDAYIPIILQEQHEEGDGSLDITPSGSVGKPGLTKGKVTSTGNFTPEGTIAFSGTENKSTTVSAANSGESTYTPAGSVTAPTFTGTGVRLETGNIPVPKTITFTGTEGSVSVSGTPDGSVSSSFTGTPMTATGTFTPSGSVTLGGSENRTATVSPAQSGDATYTPSGSVSAPTISVSSAGATTTINNPTSKTVVTDVSVSDPNATEATGELVYCSVSGETLSLKKFVETTGASITTESKTVKTGDASYAASQPTFTGTGARLVTGNIAVPTSATFSGSEGNVSVSGTPEGSVSSSFTGTAMASTGTFTPEGSATITATENKKATVSSVSGDATYTPGGSVSQPTFSGTGVRLVTGNIAVPNAATFTGTEGGVSVETTGTAVTDVAAPTFTGTQKFIWAGYKPSDIAGWLSFTGTEQTVSVTFGNNS